MSQEPAEQPWDFVAAVDALLERQGSDCAVRRWADLEESAERLVRVAKAEDPEGLALWLDENAIVLVGQQLLVRAVHGQRDVTSRMEHRLDEWRAGRPHHESSEAAVTWLKSEDPALLRAWLLDRVEELVGRELAPATQLELEPWTGPWEPDDKDANFKAEVALYAHLDPLMTLRGLSRSTGIPVGALAHYVLAKYATSGSGGLLELGPVMVHRLWEPIERADEEGTGKAKEEAFDALRAMISWLRVPLVDDEVYGGS